jgi:HEAT repeat protein
MLREALKDASVEVRCRAAEGLRQLRNEGREAIPDLLAVLREPTSGIEVSLFFNAIEEIGASPELIPDIISILKSNPDARLMIAGSLSNPNWGSPGDVAPFLRPLLGDPDSSIRMAAAYSLALLLRHEAGPEAVAAAVEALQGANGELHSVALAVLRNIGSDPSDPQGHFQASRLPASAAAAVPALAGIINNPETPSNMRQDALRILNGL